MAFAGCDGLAGPGSNKTVSSNSLGGCTLEKARQFALGVCRDFEVGCRGRDEVGRDLAVYRNKVRFLGAFLRFREELLDRLKRRKEGVLCAATHVSLYDLPISYYDQ
jgi:hypothetical protein